MTFLFVFARPGFHNIDSLPSVRVKKVELERSIRSMSVVMDSVCTLGIPLQRFEVDFIR